MAKLNWFLSLKNMAKSDETAKTLLDAINSAESDEVKTKAKAEAKEYVESFNESDVEPEPMPEPEHIEPVSEVPQAENELTVELDESEETGNRPEPQPPVDNALIARIRRRKQLAEEAVRKRQNQPITLKEQKEWAKERGRQVMERNRMMAERRAELRKLIEKQQEEARQNNAKNMVGLYTVLLREIKLRKRLQLICAEHKITRADLEKLKEVNPAGWAECVAERPWIEKELDMYIK